ncbi:hypothetical protein GCK72_016388 [Caenorhabditis remanei]|uniref:Uncharacterized protein n=1 Tax=Caenorhabditis remanei TaxID=31234 RepID=A0A6A5G4W5_CAERE|nr:hypothetical protein GCK72_016388 [Caenorhabditis remanei]KAF1749843.1 hypothetical protein GCK72_016388 [Caenorhabditis remanei]
MDRSYLKSSNLLCLSVFYVISLFAITFMMIHFIQYNSEKTAPKMNDVVVVAVQDEDPVKNPHPPYDYNSLLPCNLTKEIKNAKLNLKTVQRSFSKCVFPLITRFFGNPVGLLFNFSTVLSVCDDEEAIRDIEVREFALNSWIVLPKCKENNTLLTLGVAKDTNGDEWVKKSIPNLKMYGASGLIENSTVYENFQNFALGPGGDSMELEVIEDGVLQNKTMPLKSFEEYMTELKLTKIDALWINPYYGKFSFWDYIERDGWLAKHNITICQMTIEVPKGHGNQWIEMIKSMETNSDFVFMRPTTTKTGGARAFFINYRDPQCTRKYLE